jgi:ABC-type multidrug transport system fused ATPase/permease subunit
LGLIDQSFESRIIEARRHFAANLPAAMRGAVEFFDPASYNHAATLQDNILFGKVVTGQAEAGTRITRLLRELLDELGLRPLVVKIGLDYQVGVGGARLPVADRQKTALARALIKRPALLVLDEATAVLDPASSGRVIAGLLAERKGRGVMWVLQRPENAQHFGTVLVMERGRLVEKGVFEKLKGGDGPLRKMLQPA